MEKRTVSSVAEGEGISRLIAERDYLITTAQLASASSSWGQGDKEMLPAISTRSKCAVEGALTKVKEINSQLDSLVRLAIDHSIAEDEEFQKELEASAESARKQADEYQSWFIHD